MRLWWADRERDTKLLECLVKVEIEKEQGRYVGICLGRERGEGRERRKLEQRQR